jgi:hypothetical protein
LGVLTRPLFPAVAAAFLVLCGACSDPDGYRGGGRLEVPPGSAVAGGLNAAEASDAPADSAVDGGDEENLQDESADRRQPGAVVVTDGH